MAWDAHSVIAEAAAIHPQESVIQLEEPQQTEMLTRIMERFLFAQDAAWWWEVLNVPHLPLPGRSLDDVPNICPDPEAPIYCVPCDTLPLRVYRTSPRSVSKVFNECPFFEYALIADDLSWMIIENHHGELIVAGDVGQLNITQTEN